MRRLLPLLPALLISCGKGDAPAHNLQKRIDATRGFASRWTPGAASEK